MALFASLCRLPQFGDQLSDIFCGQRTVCAIFAQCISRSGAQEFQAMNLANGLERIID